MGQVNLYDFINKPKPPFQEPMLKRGLSGIEGLSGIGGEGDSVYNFRGEGKSIAEGLSDIIKD